MEPILPSLMERFQGLARFFEVLAILYWIGSAALAAYLARQKGYNVVVWTAIGLAPVLIIAAWYPLFQDSPALVLVSVTVLALPVLIAAAGLPKVGEPKRRAVKPKPIGLGHRVEPETEDPELAALMDRLKRKS